MGLDLGLKHIGVVILTEEGHPLRHYTLQSEPRLRRSRKGRGPAPMAEADRIERLINLANDVIGYGKAYKVRHVGIEGFAFGKANQAHQLGEIAGVVKTQLWLALSVVPEVVQVNTARKHVLGYGKPDKKQVVEVVNALGVDVDEESDHEADAYVIARWLYDQVSQGRQPDADCSEETRVR